MDKIKESCSESEPNTLTALSFKKLDDTKLGKRRSSRLRRKQRRSKKCIKKRST